MSQAQRGPQASHWLVRAWVWVALIPVFLVAVSFAALTFYRETRYDTAEHFVPEWAGGMPWWIVVIEALLSIAAVSVPCLLAVRYGRRTTAGGDPRGRAPEVVGMVALVGYALLTAVNAATNLV